ncbi:putative 20S proteasome subunit alpha type 2 [Apodospora peruviana]|uniref:20S proteasome subunit alpha type 2 n=1 Tax=Apodospora peruviana TaxID=516989 RepID=A0AAE0HZY9_9PEZI|nr:putative 20S proteasome subunit alpha type 2 [Apodospora peruviana]
MEYKQQQQAPAKIKPRLIIHGGAGNLTPANLSPDLYREYRDTLLTIVTKTHSYMHTPTTPNDSKSNLTRGRLPTALEAATFAVTLLEDNPLFNSGHGAVFTRDGINELEASVMVSRGFAKRAVGVMGLRRVRNPILLARAMLEHGDADLLGRHKNAHPPPDSNQLDVPSAQGHSQLHGAAAELLAGKRYGLKMVDPGYFFTQKRWDEHLRALEREKRGLGCSTWSKEEYLPQGTCGAIALDEDGVLCCATSTGGLTNKLTGRIGDTPTIGAGFWAEEWTEPGDPTSLEAAVRRPGPVIAFAAALKGLMADCFPTPFVYSPVVSDRADPVTTRSVAISGTGNGDSFLRTVAVRTVASMARFARVSSAAALTRVVGRSGELQKSAGDRWGMTGEGEGGMIGIECVVMRDAEGRVFETRSEILQDYNCGGMFRAWVDEKGTALARIWREDGDVPGGYLDEEVKVG